MSAAIARRLVRVVFCPNQVTAAIALALQRQRMSGQVVVAVYWPDRCDVTALRESGAISIPYSRFACLRLLVRYGIFGKLECLVPHRKLGRFVNLFAALCGTCALVDDGLDTLRDLPRNVEPAAFARRTPYYTFKYTHDTGHWLNQFQVQNVADLASLTAVARPPLRVGGVERLVIESPPLDQIQANLGLSDPRTLVVVHSNTNKRKFDTAGLKWCSGADYCIEAALHEFEGELVVGESMVAVYALSLPNPRFKLSMHLTSVQAANLGPLIGALASHGHAELHIIASDHENFINPNPRA